MQVVAALERLAGGVLALAALEVPQEIARGGSLGAPGADARACAPPDEGDAPEAPPEPAEPAVVESLLEVFAAARRAAEAEAWIAALERMAQYPNREFVDPALTALKYRASRADRAAARAEAAELGEARGRLADELLLARESRVHAAGARVLALHPDPRVGKALFDAFRARGMSATKPLGAAAIVDAMGRIGYRDAQDAVLSELTRRGDQDLLRACVRYFGQVKTTSYDAVRTLCEELAAPEPAGVDTPANPPASYWEERWKKWQHVRRDVSWALREITGQSFQPAEPSGPGDSQRALEYVRENRRELGLR